MKLFAVKNSNSDSDFGLEKDFQDLWSTNEHSGGVVIMAETEDEAKIYLGQSKGTLKEISLNKAGIVLYCDGSC